MFDCAVREAREEAGAETAPASFRAAVGPLRIVEQGYSHRSEGAVRGSGSQGHVPRPLSRVSMMRVVMRSMSGSVVPPPWVTSWMRA